MEINYDIFKNLSIEEKKIISVLQKNGYKSKSEISLITKIKLTTLNYIIQSLEKNKILVQKCIGESTGGRKPVLYDINMNKLYIIGINIAAKYIKIVITNLNMEILYKEISYTENLYSLNEIIVRIEEIINNAYLNLRLSSIELLGIGVGFVGKKRIYNENMLNSTDFVSEDWTSSEIKEMLEGKYKCLVVIESNASAAVIAEYLYGVAKGYEGISYFNCGFGIRSATISSGKLIRTINDEEDVFGHMIIDVDGEQCKCGKYGCIECYSSIGSIIRKFTSEMKKGRTSMINKLLKNISYEDICIAAEKNDDLAKEILINSALLLGTGLANYINLLNPSMVILNGPLVNNSKLFYDTCINSALEKINSSKKEKLVFNKGGYFKENAISVGAAALVIEKYLDTVI